MDPKKITELANLLRENGDKILSSESTLSLSGSLLRALNDSFTLIADSVDVICGSEIFQVVKPNNSKSPIFRDLQLIHDFVQKTSKLCIVNYPTDDQFDGFIDITKFHALQRLEVQKVNIKQIKGIQALRVQLEQIICVKSLQSVDDVITHCGGDNSNGLVWKELNVADFSYNNLRSVDTSLEFAQYLQHINLRHNQLESVKAIKWLPNLKTLDLSFNRLQYIPQLHLEAYKSLQSLNMNNNLLEDIMGLVKMEALTDLDLSDNFLMDHSCLLPLSTLITLKFLNLYGNPLHCHPKHRLATSQFLHKNAATVKFILDFEPLSKNERVITGSQQMRHVGSLNHFVATSTTKSLISSGACSDLTTPASSVGSIRSFKLNETATGGESFTQSHKSKNSLKKRSNKTRMVEIEDVAGESDADGNNSDNNRNNITDMSNSTLNDNPLITKNNGDHLEAKKQIESLRKKHGSEWLQSGNAAEIRQNILGIQVSKYEETTSDLSTQLFEDYLFKPSTNADQGNNAAFLHSTPFHENTLTEVNEVETLVSRSKSDKENLKDNNESNLNSSAYHTPIKNISEFQDENPTSESEYLSATNETDCAPYNSEYDNNSNNDDDPPHLKNIYPVDIDESETGSEPEEDEETYIVYKGNLTDAIFLTLSSNYLREKDTLTQKTKAKWSLKILESCDRIKSNTLRINFDTLKSDKQERIYTVEDGLCQELEKKLREILSKRDLTEMNQTIYRCVNCSCQFSRENKYKLRNEEIRCPDCRSTFIAQIHDIPKSLEKVAANSDLKVSPAMVVEEMTLSASNNLQLSPAKVVIEAPLNLAKVPDNFTEDDSIGRGPPRLHAINTKKSSSLVQNIRSSANSLAESSSCSKLTASESSFDSNQSVVGSTNEDRDIHFKINCESDVDIISNPSISSIEVLDQAQHSSRKTSEERRISQIPNLETIADNSYTPDSYLNQTISYCFPTDVSPKDDFNNSHQKPKSTKKTLTSSSGPIAHFNLTESSSSGSITDSVCTAYDQKDNNLTNGKTSKKDISMDSLNAENALYNDIKKGAPSVSSMFGGLFQSTNVLMSSSKKLIDAEASGIINTENMLSSTMHGKNIKSSPSLSCQPYKFNYTDFNEVDHRLKLFFYQTKFEEEVEHFKWIAYGRIFNENTKMLFDGIVVMSTHKLYMMEAVAPQHDSVSKWLHPVLSVTVDRLESIQLLPWKVGLEFILRNWGGFLLLFQDILRTDSLLLYFANISLPSKCEVIYQIPGTVSKRLSDAVHGDSLKMFSILNGCEISCDSAKRTFQTCGILTTNSHLYISSNKLGWLCLNDCDEDQIEICMTQLISNIVDVEQFSCNVFTLNFLDETQNKSELWNCTFETKENAESCLNAIAQSWEKLFGVPLLNV